MGYFHLNSDKIQGFDVRLVKETANGLTFDVILMNIVTGYINVTYRICDDDRHPDINKIKGDLELGLNQAAASNLPFGVNEYPERDYIFVTYPGGQTAQYTAKRIAG